MACIFTSPPSKNPIDPGFKRKYGFFVLNLFALLIRALTAVRRKRLQAAARGHRRAVFIEPFGMGDVLAMQPVVKAYCDAGFEVFAFVRKEWHPLLIPHPQLVCEDFRPSWTGSGKKYRNLLPGILSLRSMIHNECAGSLGIDVRGDIRTIILFYLAGCSKVQTLKRYYTANDCKVLPGVALRREIAENEPRWRVNSIFAEGLHGNAAALVPPTLAYYLLKPRGSASLSLLLAGGGGRIGLIPLTTWIGKEWFPDQWSLLIDRLKAIGKTPVVLCGPAGYNSAIEAVDGAKVAVKESRDVESWINNLAGCSAVVTVNTGPMHLAAALGVKTVVIDGPSRLPLWAPAQDNAIVVHHQDTVLCSPCHQVGDTGECRRQCMASVTADEVINALISIKAL